MECKRKILGERFTIFIETIKLTAFAVFSALIIIHPIIVLCIILGLVEKGNVVQNTFLLLLWFSDLAASAIIAYLVEYVRTR